MRLPRLRFTLRRMMVMVAFVAFSLVFLLPIFSRLRYLYITPFSVNLVWTQVIPRKLGLTGPVNSGQPVSIQCQFDSTFSEHVPSGIPYLITVEVQLIDRKTGVVEEFHRQSRYVLSGKGLSRANLSLNLTPNHAGEYKIRYEGMSQDLVGRKTMSPGIDTQWFEAR